MTNYMTIPEAARLWKAAPGIVRHECETHRILRAIRFGRSWLIPEDALRPETMAAADVFPDREATYQSAPAGR